ncbi:hypothetical protein GN958_ATG14729 [Phytophthora infestans]|uniref:Uncharacterized protein n=1 Tax=Phytophthora infestans TaxID=4787 RepID=A0A8S9U4U4_PHYIN|nr:hypothetical protein GN958_ATG14729 [Phytophthora infestans]
MTTRVQRIRRRLEPLRRPWRKTRGGLYPNPDPKPGGDPSRRRLHKSLAQPDPEATLRDLRSTSTVTVDRAVMVGGGRLVVADSLDLAEGGAWWRTLVADRLIWIWWRGVASWWWISRIAPWWRFSQDRLMVADPRDRLTVADPLDLS